MIGIKFARKVEQNFRFRTFFVFAVPRSIEEVESARKLQLHQFVVPHHSSEFRILGSFVEDLPDRLLTEIGGGKRRLHLNRAVLQIDRLVEHRLFLRRLQERRIPEISSQGSGRFALKLRMVSAMNATEFSSRFFSVGSNTRPQPSHIQSISLVFGPLALY